MGAQAGLTLLCSVFMEQLLVGSKANGVYATVISRQQ